MIQLIGAIVAIIVGVILIVGTFGRLVVKALDRHIKDATAELRNNGGSSMKDAVERIEKKVDNQGRNLGRRLTALEKAK